MAHGASRGVWVLLAFGLVSVPAFAQTGDPATTGRFEASVAAGLWGGYDLGTVSTPRLDAEATIGSGPSVTGRFGWRVWRTLAIEGGATLTRASLQSTLRSDVDAALNGSQETPFHQLAAELGVRVPLRRATLRDGRLVPFVTGGGGYLRQTYEDGVLLESGALIYAGGGLRVGPATARADRFFKHLGLRADGRLVVRTRGVDVEDSARAFLTLAAGVFVVF
jgi:hypothetical protein